MVSSMGLGIAKESEVDVKVWAIQGTPQIVNLLGGMFCKEKQNDKVPLLLIRKKGLCC